MSEYDFSTLSPLDFELLVRDILQAEMGIRIDSFKPGRDAGIDLRYLISDNKYLIVQCKHYIGSGFSRLYSKLRKEEIDKIIKLKPHRYTLVTSIGLSPRNKTDILALIRPHVHEQVEILGKEDLNNLLRRHPEIEKQHYKLWLASATVLQQIVNSGIFNMTDIEIKAIKHKMGRYVQNTSFLDACNLLDKYRICIISGVPGIGKTTLAEIMLLHYMEKGFNVIKISTDINEAYQIYTRGDKTIYYYDDFLGQTSIYDKFNKNEENRLIQFMEEIRRSKHKRFILTTREYILNQARLRYERLDRANFNPFMYVVDLASYTRRDRAHILFNHLFFADVSSEHIRSLISSAAHRKIIDHKNFSPRVIEWMTDSLTLTNISSQRYPDEFLDALNNPAKIWDHAYLYQIASTSQSILLTLLSFPFEVSLTELREAIRTHSEASSTSQSLSLTVYTFQNSLKELEGTFVSLSRYQLAERAETIIRFHNPSIRDYLRNVISADPELGKQLISNVVYFEQFVQIISLIISSYPANVVQGICSGASDLLKRVIDRPLWRYKTLDEYQNRGVTHSIYCLNYEDRLAQIITVSDRLPIPEKKSLYQFCALKFKERLTSFVPHISDAFSVMKAIDNENISQKMRSTLLQLVWNLSISKAEVSEDFSAIIDLIEIYPNVATPIELDSLKDRFNTYCSELGDPSFEDQDEYAYEASSIERIGDYFDIDVSDVVEDLRQYMRPSYDEDEYEGGSDRFGSNHIGSIGNDDVDSMFQDLL